MSNTSNTLPTKSSLLPARRWLRHVRRDVAYLLKGLRLFLLATSLLAIGCAHKPSQPDLIGDYVDQIRQGHFDDPMPIVETADTEDVRKAIGFLKDSSSDVRFRMLEFLLQVGHAQTASIDTKVLAHDGVVAAATQTDDSALAGEAAELALDPHYYWELSPSQADRVINTVKAGKFLRPELILLVGWNHGAQVKDRLQELAKPAFGNATKAILGSPAWSAVLALARAGDPPSLTLVLKVTKALRAERDSAFSDVIPAKYLGYVAQPETVKLLLGQLFSEEKWDTGHGRKDSAAAYAVDPLLAALDHIPDELVRLDPDIDRAKRITKLRTWAREQDEFVLRDSKRKFTWHPQ